jgi:signal transduction histidine kinase
MGEEIVGNPVYRTVVAKLRICEDRYRGLIESIKTTEESRLATAIATLKSEVLERRRLEAELLTAVEKERQRIGQDLHDDLCQRLGATALLTASLVKQIAMKDRRLGRELARIPGLINDTIESCRELARGLHPVTLASKGLPAALQELAARMPKGIKFRWPTGKRIELEHSVALHFYRIAEEAVGNAVKHSDAKNITIELDVLDGRPVLVVSDDGKGFDEKLESEGMGLNNMRYRAGVIGAKLEFEQRKSGGTRVRCRLPVAKADRR